MQRQRPIGIADGMYRAATTHRVHPTRIAGISHVYACLLLFFNLMHHRRMQYRHAIVCKIVCALWYAYAQVNTHVLCANVYNKCIHAHSRHP